MKINEFVKPYVFATDFSSQEIGFRFKPWKKDKDFENNVLLFGLSNYNGETGHLDKLRDVFYRLSNISGRKKFIDLGNIISLSIRDREEALSAIVKIAKKHKSVLIMLSSETDQSVHYLTKANGVLQPINVIPAIDGDDIYMTDLDAHVINTIFYVGWQAHFSRHGITKPIANIDAISLGSLRDDLMDVEPYFRMSEAANFDLSSIRFSDYSKSYRKSPNGLYAEEICQLAWFAGNSDSISLYNLTSIPETVDYSTSDFMMASQSLWYILTGIAKRYMDDPGKNTCNFKEYYIENNKMPEDVVFYKSVKSGKFWVKYGKEKKFIPCSKKDMDVVLEGNVPDRLLKRIAIGQKK